MHSARPSGANLQARLVQLGLAVLASTITAATASEDDQGNVTMLIWKNSDACSNNPSESLSIGAGECTLLDLGIPEQPLSAVKLWCTGGLSPEVSIDLFHDAKCQNEDREGRLSGYCYKNGPSSSFVFACDSDPDADDLWHSPISAILCAVFVGVALFGICRWQQRFRRRRAQMARRDEGANRPYGPYDAPGMSPGRTGQYRQAAYVQATAVTSDSTLQQAVVVADGEERPSMQSIVGSVMADASVPPAERQSRIMQLFHAHAYAGTAAAPGQEALPPSARREDTRTPLLATPADSVPADAEEGVVAVAVEVGPMDEGVVAGTIFEGIEAGPPVAAITAEAAPNSDAV